MWQFLHALHVLRTNKEVLTGIMPFVAFSFHGHVDKSIVSQIDSHLENGIKLHRVGEVIGQEMNNGTSRNGAMEGLMK